MNPTSKYLLIEPKSKLYEETINHYLQLFPETKITVGGVFPSLNPEWFQKWNGSVTVLLMGNAIVPFRDRRNRATL